MPTAKSISKMKHLNTILLVTLSLFLGNEIVAQGSHFGVKGGLTIGTQKWNSYERDPLFKYHGIVFIESLDETNSFSLFAQAGWHAKGSAIRYQRSFVVPGTSNVYSPPADHFIFNNVSLTVGAKMKNALTERSRYYYLFGLRGEYTVSTNLDDYNDDQYFRAFYPFEQFVQKLNYGVTVGGGLDFDISEFVGAFLELTVNPDLSFQYKQPAIGNVTSPFTSPGQTISIGERSIRNLTFEVSLGIRFLRLVEYID